MFLLMFFSILSLVFDEMFHLGKANVIHAFHLTPLYNKRPKYLNHMLKKILCCSRVSTVLKWLNYSQKQAMV